MCPTCNTYRKEECKWWLLETEIEVKRKLALHGKSFGAWRHRSGCAKKGVKISGLKECTESSSIQEIQAEPARKLMEMAPEYGKCRESGVQQFPGEPSRRLEWMQMD